MAVGGGIPKKSLIFKINMLPLNNGKLHFAPPPKLCIGILTPLQLFALRFHVPPFSTTPLR